MLVETTTKLFFKEYSMENEEGLWTNKQTNSFFRKQLKGLLKPYGFQVYPKGSRYFTRVKMHYVQAVYQEVLCGGTTSFQMIVTPTFTYQKAWFFSGDRVYPKCGMEVRTGTGHNFYTRLAFKLGPTKESYYKPDELMSTWDNMIKAQIKEDIVDYFEQLDFEKYQILCEERRDEVLRYCSSGDSLRFYAVGYNNIWQKNYDKAEVYLAKGISEAQCVIQKREEVNYPQNPDFNKDLYAAREIMSILHQKEDGWEKLLAEKLYFLEKDALEKVWGITLNSGDNL